MTKPRQQPEAPSATCERVRACAWEFLDEELAACDEQAVEAHLGACPPCREEIERDRALIALVQRLEGCDPAPGSLRARVAALLGTDTRPDIPR